MTNNSPTTSTGNRRGLSGLLVIFILIGSWVAYFLITFDLNDYRKYLEKELSDLLSLPVRIDKINYNFHETNLALHFYGLQVGDATSLLQVNIPDAILDLQWRGLFIQQFKFTRIDLIGPEIWIRRNNAAKASPTAAAPSPEMDQVALSGTSVRSLEIVDGTVHVDLPDSGTTQKQLLMTGLRGDLSEIRLNQPSRLHLEGAMQLPGQGASSPWELRGEASLQLDESGRLHAYTDLALSIKQFEFNALNALLADRINKFNLAGTGDLELRLKGNPGKAFDFHTVLSSDRFEILPGPAYSTPVSCRNLLASGQFMTGENQLGINNLSLKVDEAHLAGAIQWSRPGHQPFSARISLVNSRLTIPQIKQWLPDIHESWETVRENLKDHGTVFLEATELQFHAEEGTRNSWQLDSMKGEIQQVTWQSGAAPELQIKSLPFDLQKGRWQTDDSLITMGSLDISAYGHGEYGHDRFSVTSLDFSGDALPERLFSDWYVPKGAWKTRGKAAISGHLQGSYKQLSLDLQADLSRLYLNHPAGLKLTPGEQDKLSIHASFSPKEIKLDHGSIKWSAAKGHLTGSYLIGDPDSLVLDALLTIDDLSRLTEALPLLDKLQLHGQADLSIAQRGRRDVNRPTMTLTLRDAGLRATRHIADLSLINGRINVTPDGLDTENLSIHLGESLLTVKAKLDDFTDPHLTLDIKAATVRAQDIIFPSPKALLRDLNGHLEIDRAGLLFAPVKVRLDGGTDATVSGTIDFAPPYPVMLDITSDYALISEVIDLWASGPAAKKQVEAKAIAPAARPQSSIRITARVKAGDLYGMRFHDAAGVIVPSRERLMIHPLDFSVGEGYCNAQVLTDFVRGGPSRLRVSGHAEDVDALEVYRELLNQENILRGTLRGDFYLAGDIGSNFLRSSHGRFSIQIKDGVLRQFPVLSKVFSLLNVSQIFALQLPDMDLEGMPYEILTANFQLDKGILRSEDLTIRSEAMNQSYTGQLDLVSKEVDLAMAIHPLGTVDKIITRIPVAGWLLTGKDKALLTAHFSVSGPVDDVSVMIMPLDTLSEPTIGLLRRTLGLPFKLLEDPQILWGGDPDEE